MQRIFLFLYQIRALLLFVLLQTIAISILVRNNSPQGAAFFNSANHLSGNIMGLSDDITSYFSLSSVNKGLAEKNAELLTNLEAARVIRDSAFIEVDSSLNERFNFLGAKVINNSIRLSQNHLTLNKGEKHGVRPGMGVFNEEGVVGRVKNVSKNYTTVISLLHTDLLISSKIVSNGVFGSTKWDGKDSKMAKLLYVPRHVELKAGDKVVTSGYNEVFPEGIAIGEITDFGPGIDNNYLDITLELSTDFSKVSFVYLVENPKQTELDSLQQSTKIQDE